MDKSFNQEIVEGLKEDAKSLCKTMRKYIANGNDLGSNTYKNLAQNLEKIMYIINEYDESKPKVIQAKDIVVNGNIKLNKNDVEILLSKFPQILDDIIKFNAGK